jgi:hypothetical protein
MWTPQPTAYGLKNALQYPRDRAFIFLILKKINWKDGVAALAHLVRFNMLKPLDQCFKDLPERYSPR